MKWLIAVFLSFHLQVHADTSLRDATTFPTHVAFLFKSKKALLLEENLQGGRQLKLNDGTTWDVAPQDVKKVTDWVLPSPLTLRKSGRKDYPYYLVNNRSKVQVLVRLSDVSDAQNTQVPQTPAQQTDLPPAIPKPTQPPIPENAQPSGSEPVQSPTPEHAQ